MHAEKKSYRAFLMSVSIAVVLSLSGIFWGIALQTEKLFQQQMLAEARAHFSSIVLTRQWNASYGGVYVEKKESVRSNPYLIAPDLRSTDGRVYTLINPATMTREISEYADKRSAFSFHITSLKLLNPWNKADKFETGALKEFEAGAREVYAEERMGGRTFFRYMAPLYVKPSCLGCHEEQGYNVGDVRGGISVNMDIDELEGIIKKNLNVILTLGVASIIILLGFIYFFLSKLNRELGLARQTIERLAITDGLTGIYNRRHLMQRFREEFVKTRRLDNNNLGCILIDIDNFKRVNDTYGHLVGDRVLEEIPHIIKDIVRAYDVLGRYGGEEFLVAMPSTNSTDMDSIAHRLRVEIKDTLAARAGLNEDDEITISLGVAYIRDEDSDENDMLHRADQGMYQAKQAGRNRVGWYESEGNGPTGRGKQK